MPRKQSVKRDMVNLVCDHCDSAFTRPKCNNRDSFLKFCTTKCFADHRRIEPPEEVLNWEEDRLVEHMEFGVVGGLDWNYEYVGW